MLCRSLAIGEKSLGRDHPHVAIDLNNLALLLQDTNRVTEAEPLMRRALEIDEESLGPDHPNVAVTLNGLAFLYSNQGKYEEAEPLLKRSLEILEKAFGPDHPNLGMVLSNLGELFANQGKSEEAEPLYERALSILAKTLESDHSGLVELREAYAVIIIAEISDQQRSDYQGNGNFQYHQENVGRHIPDHFSCMLLRHHSFPNGGFTFSLAVVGDSFMLHQLTA